MQRGLLRPLSERSVDNGYPCCVQRRHERERKEHWVDLCREEHIVELRDGRQQIGSHLGLNLTVYSMRNRSAGVMDE